MMIKSPRFRRTPQCHFTTPHSSNLVPTSSLVFALALEPAEPDVLSQSPHGPDEPMSNCRTFEITFESTTYPDYSYGLWVRHSRAGIGSQASTIAFMSLTSGQLLHAISCRSEELTACFDFKQETAVNQYLVLLGFFFALQLLAIATPRGILNIAD